MIPARASRLRVVSILLLALIVIGRGAVAAPLGGDFTVQSSNGAVALADLRGKVVPVYFGYMSCPDLCPMTLSVLGAALRSLDATELEQVHALFVSLDPERDDLERLAEYARYFHAQITGVTASPEVLEDVTRRYRVKFAPVPSDAAGQYMLDHTSRLILIGRDGKMQRVLPDGTPAEVVATAIRELLAR